MTEVAAMPIYGVKPLKNLLLQNQLTNDLEIKYVARLGGKFHPRYLPVAFNGIYQSGKYSKWQILAN